MLEGVTVVADKFCISKGEIVWAETILVAKIVQIDIKHADNCRPLRFNFEADEITPFIGGSWEWDCYVGQKWNLIPLQGSNG